MSFVAAKMHLSANSCSRVFEVKINSIYQMSYAEHFN